LDGILFTLFTPQKEEESKFVGGESVNHCSSQTALNLHETTMLKTYFLYHATKLLDRFLNDDERVQINFGLGD
jgi:hypothetical protein